MLNYSAIDTRIDIAFSNGVNHTLESSDFAFESDPLTIHSAPVGRMEPDLNGHPIISRTRQPINLTLNLIPGCEGDKALQDVLYAMRGSGDDVKIERMTVLYPTTTRIQFENGIISSGIPGVGLSPEGKIRNGGVYELSFATYMFSGSSFVNNYTDNNVSSGEGNKKQPQGDKSRKTTANSPKKVISGKWGWGIQF